MMDERLIISLIILGALPLLDFAASIIGISIGIFSGNGENKNENKKEKIGFICSLEF